MTDPEIEELLKKQVSLLEYLIFIFLLQLGWAETPQQAWKIIKELSKPSSSDEPKE